MRHIKFQNAMVLPMLFFCLLPAPACKIIAPGLPKPEPVVPIPPPEPSLSTISATLHADLDFKPALAQFCTYYDGEADIDSPFPLIPVSGKIKYQVWTRDEEPDSAPRISLANNSIHVSAKYRYQAKGSILVPFPPCFPLPCPFQCGQNQEFPRTLDVSTDLAIKVDPKWFLKIENQPQIQSAPCKVTFRNFDVTGKVENAVRNAANRVVDKANGELRKNTDVYHKMQSIWPTLFEPIDLEDGRFITLNPQAAFATPMTAVAGDSPAIELVMGFTAKPFVSLGIPSLPGKPIELPDIQEIPSTKSGFEIYSDVAATYTFLQNQLNASDLVTKPYPVGKHNLKIQNVEISGYGSKVLMSFNINTDVNPYHYPAIVDVVTGVKNGSLRLADAMLRLFTGAHGRLIFVGTPSLSDSNRKVSFPDLKYTTETRNVVAALAEWIFRAQLEEKLRRVKCDLGKLIDKERVALIDKLNRKLDKDGKVLLVVNIDRLGVRDIFVANQGIVLRTNSTGSIAIRTKWPD
jgi:hypothetical protein